MTDGRLKAIPLSTYKRRPSPTCATCGASMWWSDSYGGWLCVPHDHPTPGHTEPPTPEPS
jgi:hypothetical protein